MVRATQSINYDQVTLSKKERVHQTRMIMQLFKLWGLTYKQQAIILGLSPNTETSIYSYKIGKQSLPLFRDIQDRVGHLFAIHKALRQIYPYNKELAYLWITASNTDFNHQSPFDVICKEGYLGLVRVRQYLELNQLA